MATAIAVYNSDGCVGRCDATCHEAKHATCTCICGGINHGKGLQQAIRNNEELLGFKSTYLPEFAEARGLDPKTLVLVDRIKTPGPKDAYRLAHMKLNQLDLFEDDFEPPTVDNEVV